jgi:hypothetical protein
LNRLVDFHEIRYGGNSIQEELDEISFNPTASIIVKLLIFKFFLDEPCSAVGLDGLYTMVTKLFALGNHGKCFSYDFALNYFSDL